MKPMPYPVLYRPAPAHREQSRARRSACIVALAALALVGLFDLWTGCRLDAQQDATAARQASSERRSHARPEDAAPAHVLNIADKLEAGRPLNELEQAALDKWVREHPEAGGKFY